MANNPLFRGFSPVPNADGSVDVIWLPKKTSTTSSLALLIGSPVVVGSGVVDAVGTANSDTMTGAVVGLKDSTGGAVSYLAGASTDGMVGFTFKADQRFIAVIDSAEYADTDAGNKYYTIATETATSTDAYSRRTLTGENATGIILVGERVKKPQNDAGVANCEVYCTIKSASHVPV